MVAGSSPRVRGEGSLAQRFSCASRIIPAGAGRRRRAEGTWERAWDHPRGCGEKLPAKTAGEKPEGSSPRVRGEAECRSIMSLSSWIIPAGAGRSTIVKRGNANAWDHPRGCGEKVWKGRCNTFAQGSSPRVRGEGTLEEPPRAVAGIIPAGAGRS